jgi:hypothetical protein
MARDSARGTQIENPKSAIEVRKLGDAATATGL